MTISQAAEFCVTNFPSSVTRAPIFQEFIVLCSYFIDIGLPCEVWVDGSFVTSKENPADLDLCIMIFTTDFDKLDKNIAEIIIGKFNGNKLFREVLDTFICFKYLREDPRASSGNEDYWGSFWGADRENYLKGFVVIGIGESDVQRRITS